MASILSGNWPEGIMKESEVPLCKLVPRQKKKFFQKPVLLKIDFTGTHMRQNTSMLKTINIYLQYSQNDTKEFFDYFKINHVIICPMIQMYQLGPLYRHLFLIELDSKLRSGGVFIYSLSAHFTFWVASPGVSFF